MPDAKFEARNWAAWRALVKAVTHSATTIRESASSMRLGVEEATRDVWSWKMSCGVNETGYRGSKCDRTLKRSWMQYCAYQAGKQGPNRSKRD